ncbi:MAG TPA: AAA domain-containing protein [Candidatus Sulfotelmatobacter sp.]|nr:AAA domain-containing protein [Candidatus Sulfotelmatobacter sp.]
MPLPQDIHQAIIEELRAQKRQRHSLWLLIDKTEVLDEKPSQFIYRLTLAEEIRVPPDSILVIKVPGQDGSVEVQVLYTAERTLVVMSQQPLPHQMAMVRVEFDPTFILKKLEQHLDQVLRFPPSPLKALLARALPDGNSSTATQTGSGEPRHDERLNQFQHDSVLRMQFDEVHLLWGPPGTGKTHTVGMSVSRHVQRKKTCLLLSTSNSAVDEMVRATGCALGDEGLEHVFRAGVTADKETQPFTCIGLLEKREPEVAAAVRRADQRLRELTLNLPTLLKIDSSDKIFEEMQQCKNLIAGFAARAKAFAESLAADSRCVAATLAMLVINPTLSKREFDVVYIDEASMVSLPFAFAGAAQAAEQVIFAGDFRQLSPICRSEKREVREWFGRNVFDYLGVSQRTTNGVLPPFVSMLREQYRMTESIAQVVSDLSYFGKLITNEEIGVGKRPVFVDVSQLCSTSPYSVHESSYYQPHSLLLLSVICNRFHEWLGPDNLLLSPFRAQRALLDAASKDLSKPNRQLSASTIHKAQGSQEHTVIVDLTAHSADNPQKFFTGGEAENLINVALSRAQQNLVVFGSVRLVQTLATANEYWRRFWDKVRDGYVQIPVRDVVSEVPRFGDLCEAWTDKGWEPQLLPSVFVESSSELCPEAVKQRFAQTKLGIKLIVITGGRVPSTATNDGITYRNSRTAAIPPFATWQGYLGLPLTRQWTVFRMPETTKRLATVACGHLYEAPFEVTDTHRLLCIRCSHPLLLRLVFGKVVLCCGRGYCGYSRTITPQDAQTLVEVQHIKCPICGSRPQPRRQRVTGNVFLGCSNYPRCEGIVNLSLYADAFGH